MDFLVISAHPLKLRRQTWFAPVAAALVICGAVFFAALASAQSAGEPNQLLTLWAGTVPIILAAPHGGRQSIPGVAIRQGVGVSQFTVQRDTNTAELTEALAGKLADKLGARPFLVIAQFDRKYVDVNRPPSGAYESAAAKPYYDAYHGALEKACARVREAWGGGLLLDIHGQNAASHTIFRGTDNGKSVSRLARRFGRDALSGPRSILGQLALKGYSIVPESIVSDREVRYTGGYTTRNYGSHRGTEIDVMQLELGDRLRARANLNNTADDLAQAIEVFARHYLPVGGSENAARPSP